MIMKNKVVAATTSLLGASGLLFATAGSAAAGVDHTASWHRAVYTGITVEFWENGDKIKICDTAANGYAAQASWGNDNGYYGPVRVTRGKGDCEIRSASRGQNIEENTRVWINMAGLKRDAHEFEFLNDH